MEDGGIVLDDPGWSIDKIGWLPRFDASEVRALADPNVTFPAEAWPDLVRIFGNCYSTGARRLADISFLLATGNRGLSGTPWPWPC